LNTAKALYNHHTSEDKMRILLGALALFLTVTSSAMAYGPTGHRVVAELAFRHMTPETLAAVEAILGDEFMAEAANWPDEMKSSPDPYFGRTAGPYHYVNLPDGVSYKDSEKNPAGDMVSALAAFTTTVKDKNAKPEDRALALRYIIHLIGDLHQPLHAGRAQDQGGNRIDVVWFEQVTNLHKVWDEHLIQHKRLSFTEWVNFLDRKIKPAQIMQWQDSNASDWVEELVSYRGDIYANSVGILKWDYVYKHTPLIKSQLSKGGIRLAGYLNTLFAQ
jgi:nuclease S1